MPQPFVSSKYMYCKIKPTFCQDQRKILSAFFAHFFTLVLTTKQDGSIILRNQYEISYVPYHQSPLLNTVYSTVARGELKDVYSIQGSMFSNGMAELFDLMGKG
jgi:hypothetical protein